MSRFAAILAVCGLAAFPASAGSIERACLKSDRGSGQRHLCGCIQSAANVTLTARDQKLAAGFFANPEKAQEVRTSNRRGDEAFWERYRQFGETAQVYCRR